MRINLQHFYALLFSYSGAFYVFMLSIGGSLFWATPAVAQTPTRTPTPLTVEIYLPVITGAEDRSGHTITGQPIGPISGLVGQIHRATGRSFGNYLLTDDNLTYGLVGANVAWEQQIVTLRDQDPPIAVVIWGMAYQIVGAEDIAVIVVDRVQSISETAGATNVALPTAIVKFDLVNLRAGPANTYARAGQVVRGQQCMVVGRNRPSTWWEVACSEAVRGWIDRRLVDLRGEATNVPITEPTIIVVITPSPTPTATATPLPPTATPGAPPSFTWRAAYYNNRDLAGTPVVVQEVAALNFTWGANPPVAQLAADNFSVRFERTYNFTEGFYRFSLNADDGVRLWLDDELLFDEWHGATNRTYTSGRTLRGNHILRIDYYEASGLASLRFLIEFITAFPEWEVAYFDGVNPTGAPVFTGLEARTATPLDYNWESSSPLPDRLDVDHWSVRWLGQFRFNYATYVFRATADDGVRVYLNDQLILDSWRDGYNDVTNRFYAVGAGIHTIRVEYYERTGNAAVRVWWYEDVTNSPR